MIHQEYGVYERTKERYDICILPPEDVERINGYRLTVGGHHIRPIAIVEYTTERYGQFRDKKAGIERGDWVDKFAWDITKLRSSGVKGTYAKLFYRVLNKTESGARRHMERYEPRLLSVIREARSRAPSVNVGAIAYYLYKGEWEDIRE